ncbi:MAG: DUF1249 domain-containing protein [Sinobacteraceae bacterium]|nr:DUF1249 domain-containing protein [Nevskiaceae bacterium]MCP5359862.1 DUF1249 domain-containing protein [Nevskiaceae bacterium]MCP5467104.1 DUF1249 domain-containing protein [Nevskiaceae bacterium]
MVHAPVIADSSALTSWRARPRSFVALMGLYESNYTRLGWLVEDVRKLGDLSMSVVDGDCELVLKMTERGPYTATFTLTYLLPEREAPGAVATSSPDLSVRVYHDARLAEALDWAPVHEHQILRRIRRMAERELDQCWARNTMLNKWLEYCVERGHRFPQPQAQP